MLLSTSCILCLILAQAGEVTVGLTSHWPCVTDISGKFSYFQLRAHGLGKGDEHPAHAPTGLWVNLPLHDPLSAVVLVPTILAAPPFCFQTTLVGLHGGRRPRLGLTSARD